MDALRLAKYLKMPKFLLIINTETTFLSIYLLTWNVVTVEPPPLDQLKNLFDQKVDLIAIGLQEVKSQPQNIINDALYEDSWTNAIRQNILVLLNICFLL